MNTSWLDGQFFGYTILFCVLDTVVGHLLIVQRILVSLTLVCIFERILFKIGCMYYNLASF